MWDFQWVILFARFFSLRWNHFNATFATWSARRCFFFCCMIIVFCSRHHLCKLRKNSFELRFFVCVPKYLFVQCHFYCFKYFSTLFTPHQQTCDQTCACRWFVVVDDRIEYVHHFFCAFTLMCQCNGPYLRAKCIYKLQKIHWIEKFVSAMLLFCCLFFFSCLSILNIWWG